MLTHDLELFRKALVDAAVLQWNEELGLCTETAVSSDAHKVRMHEILHHGSPRPRRHRPLRIALIAAAIAAALVITAYASPLLDGIRDFIIMIYESIKVEYQEEGNHSVHLTLNEEGDAYTVTKVDRTEDVEIPAVFKGFPVTRIAGDTFAETTRDFRSVRIPDSITCIEAGAFAAVGKIQKLYLPSLSAWCAIEFSDSDSNPIGKAEMLCSADGTELTELDLRSVTVIRDYAFYHCPKVGGIRFSDQLTEIGNYAFSRSDICFALTIPDSVKIIGDFAFANSAITRLTLPIAMERIGDGAFAGCVRLSYVTFPDTMTQLGKGAFNMCITLKAAYLPGGISEVGDLCFAGCTALESADIAPGTERIGRSAFSGCRSLKQIALPNSVTDIGAGAFSGCRELQNFEIPKEMTVIAERTFAGCGKLWEITLPEGLTEIGEEAFSGCAVLELQFGDRLEKIGNRAFQSCKYLKKVCIPRSVSVIGAEAFDACGNLREVHGEDLAAWCRMEIGTPIAPGSMLYIGGEPVTALVIPEGVDCIGAEAFGGFRGMVSVTLPESVREIGAGAFEKCEDLSRVILPEGLLVIGDSAFSGCNALADLTIPSTVQVLGNAALFGCRSLKWLEIRSVGIRIGEECCRQFGALSEIRFSGTKQEWNGLSKGALWRRETGEFLLYCADGELTKPFS